jgi:addiction module RelE/StbE family toxin
LYLSDKAKKNLKKIAKKDKKGAKIILDGLDEIQKNPHDFEFLKGKFKGKRKYKKNNYRIIYEIRTKKNLEHINVLKLGNRNSIYNTHLIIV